MFSTFRRLVLAFTLAATLLTACRPPTPDPTPDDAAVVTPASWTDTARTVVDILEWAVPASKLVVSAWGRTDPATTAHILRALDAVTQEAIPGFRRALDAYDRTRSGGDRCEARAAARGVIDALLAVADALAAGGVGLAEPIGVAIGSLGGIVDELTPACQFNGADAGFASEGERIRDHLRRLPVSLAPFPPLARDAGR